jgi:hypothetical protein
MVNVAIRFQISVSDRVIVIVHGNEEDPAVQRATDVVPGIRNSGTPSRDLYSRVVANAYLVNRSVEQGG